ncbi:hypothetical protein [Sphingomicrobium marinum]|uniref:hypothetical protein n=1 Tax=Sphingomicrobium marinum TaxID=1227950 RepID=UPI0022407F06|nr:hypothetical protein [Sphingomicrobium marinum]
MTETRQRDFTSRKLDGLWTIQIVLAALQVAVILSESFAVPAVAHTLLSALCLFSGLLVRNETRLSGQVRFFGSVLVSAAAINLSYVLGYFLDRGGFIYTTTFIITVISSIVILRGIWKRSLDE